jgi:hypothetical protein
VGQGPTWRGRTSGSSSSSTVGSTPASRSTTPGGKPQWLPALVGCAAGSRGPRSCDCLSRPGVD